MNISIFINERALARRERMTAYVDHSKRGYSRVSDICVADPFLSDPPFDFVLEWNGSLFRGIRTASGTDTIILRFCERPSLYVTYPILRTFTSTTWQSTPKNKTCKTNDSQIVKASKVIKLLLAVILGIYFILLN